MKYYHERRTTSHWPYSAHVNGLQPQTYGNTDLMLDYEKLSKPDLSEFDERIREII